MVHALYMLCSLYCHCWSVYLHHDLSWQFSFVSVLLWLVLMPFNDYYFIISGGWLHEVLLISYWDMRQLSYRILKLHIASFCPICIHTLNVHNYYYDPLCTVVMYIAVLLRLFGSSLMIIFCLLCIGSVRQSSSVYGRAPNSGLIKVCLCVWCISWEKFTSFGKKGTEYACSVCVSL